MTSGTGAMPGAPTPCPRLHDCGAYVLDALDDDERRAHEAHLPACAECSAAVAEFAGLPALLRTADGTGAAGEGPTGGSSADGSSTDASAGSAGEPADPAAAEVPVPDTLLPRLLHAISAEERRARRRRVGLGLVAAAAAAVLGGASMAVVDANPFGGSGPAGTADRSTPAASAPSDPGSGPAGAPPERIALATEPGAPIAAYVLVEAEAWGTSFETHCTYTGGGPGSGYPGSADYELVAVDAGGNPHTVSTWAAGGSTAHVVPASSSLGLDQIRSLRLVTVDGTVLASATL